MAASATTTARQAPTSASAEGLAPEHVAIVMDGNHRWARARRLPGAAGHRAGARNVKAVARACADLGVRYLTLFAFSTENWRRPPREVRLLLDLMRAVLRDDVEELDRRRVRLRLIGERRDFPADLRMAMTRAERMTASNDRLFLSIAVNYGGRWDITQAARRLAREAREGRLDPDSIDESRFASCLALGEMPPPDLCIRTGGDQRLSNFLLWDFAYTEFYFTDTFWPDFDRGELRAAFSDFVARQRRFGRRETA